MCEATAWRSHELSGAKDSERSERGQASEARTLCTFVWNSYTVHDNEWKRLSFAHPARCRRSPLQAKPAASEARCRRRGCGGGTPTTDT